MNITFTVVPPTSTSCSFPVIATGGTITTRSAPPRPPAPRPPVPPPRTGAAAAAESRRSCSRDVRDTMYVMSFGNTELPPV
jgi:hypothetical protein